MTMILIMALVFFALIAVGVPIAFSMGSASVMYLLANDISISVAAQKFFTQTQSFSFLAVPFFILAGTLMVEAGIAKKLINFASVLVRHLPAGLGCVSVVTSMLLAGISGSSVADASSVGAILIPEMNDRGYPKSFSAAINATSSVVGIIIPPSSTMIVISAITGLSVSKLFMAGAIPGIIIGLAYLVITVYMGITRKYPREERANRHELWVATKDALIAMVFPVFMIGSMVLGIATCTESASICAIYSLLVGLFVYRTLDFKKILKALTDAAIGTTVVMMVVSCASIMQFILISNQVPAKLSAMLLGLGMPNWLLLVCMVLLLGLAGMVMDNVPNLYIFLPIYLPIAASIGMDAIQMAIICLCTLALGLFTPPVGTTLFISCNISKCSIESVVRDLIPFFIAGLLIVIGVAFVPGLTLWLPGLMG
ncbi:MAG: TRAP transporter large permease [Candidatus Limivicinus sp.]